MTLGLTKRQADLLKIIRDYIDEHGYSPSYVELADAMQIKSLGNIHDKVRALQERGHLEYRPGAARSITLINQ